MKKGIFVICSIIMVILTASATYSAYHHMGEMDSDKFLETYQEKAGTKLDHCALCHSGGQYESKGKLVSLGSCQWCHYSYGYDGNGNILETMNPYGQDYHDYGRNVSAIRAIETLDSDGDGFTNIIEIQANRFPGDADDDPNKVTAPFRIYTKAQLEDMTQHTQFLLMNTSRQEDFYAEYKGVTIEDLLQDVGILDSATGVKAYAPDGFSYYHPLEVDEDQGLYHVIGTYPAATYQYNQQADLANGGWCDYSAPSCVGRSHGDPISVPGGLKALLAVERDGTYLTPGVLNQENKLDGEGPFRLVVPQKSPCPPDQAATAENQDVVWPYNSELDHNAGSCSRSVTIIKVEPLPQGTTDIDILEAGWSYVDQGKIIVYGAIDSNDANGNGIFNREEGNDPNQDLDNDGIPDFEDSDTASLRHSQGNQKLCLHTSKGAFTHVEAFSSDDPAIPQSGKPSFTFPYGTVKFEITGLDPNQGESVTVKIAFPDMVPARAKYYKISAMNGWYEIPFEREGEKSIKITLTDGDPDTDADMEKNGTILDPGALGIPLDEKDSSDSNCFIRTIVPSFRGEHLLSEK